MAFGQGLYIPQDPYNDARPYPVMYEVNLDQVIDTDTNLRPDVHYRSVGATPNLYLRENSTVSLVLATTDTLLSIPDTLYRIDLFPIGDPAMQVNPQRVDTLPGLRNYYLPHTSPGLTGVTTTSRVVYEEIFDRIDWHFYGGIKGAKTAFVIRPGGDPNQLKLGIHGADSISIDLVGDLKVFLNGRWLVLREAMAYQLDSLGNVVPMTWDAEYVQIGGLHAIEFAFGNYDTTRPLILLIGEEPPAGGGGGGGSTGLEWSTTVGNDYQFGSTGASGDYINTSTVDPDGNLYVAGSTGDNTFPASTGATSYAGNYNDVFIGKFLYAPGNSTLDALNIWVDYYGGYSWEKPLKIYYSNITERVYCAGWTKDGTGFPVIPTSDPADGTFWQGTRKGAVDGWFAVFDPANGNIIRSTFFGGDGDDIIATMVEDRDGNIFLSGGTSSPDGAYGTNCTSPSSGFPLCDPNVGNYQQDSKNGGTDAFIAKLSDDFHLLWSTFFGNNGNDLPYDMTYYESPNIPLNDRIILVGSSTGGMPQTGASIGFQQSAGWPGGGFISTFHPSGTQEWSTDVEGLQGLYATASYGLRLYVLGVARDDSPTLSSSCSAVSGAIPICDPGGGAYVDDTHGSTWQDHFMAEFNLFTGDLNWSTLIGDAGDEYPDQAVDLDYQMDWQIFEWARYYDLELDAIGNIYMLGITMNDAAVAPTPYTTQWAYGHYFKDFNTNMGNGQSEVVLMCFRNDRSLYWSSMFGSWFDTYSDPVLDFWYYGFGWDVGHDMSIAPGKCIYWVGTTGGWNYDATCPYPYPGPSYCEDPPTSGSVSDGADGFIARMNLVGINVGAPDRPAQPSGIALFPVPSSSSVTVLCKGQRPTARQVQVTDALGHAIAPRFTTAGDLDVSRLGAGVYTVTLIGMDGVRLGTERFIVP